MHRFRALSPASLALALVMPAAVSAQFRASEAASISQTIDGTRISVEFSRPQARGRDPLFGKVVRWGETWTPGANWATTLEVSKDVKVNGHAVAKGKYSVWMVVRRESDWTVVLDPQSHRFHMSPPDSSAQQIRFAVRPEQRPFLEILTWSFPMNRITGATLTMQWGTTYVPLEVEVQPSHPLTLAVERSGAYLGTYDFLWKSGSGMPESTKPVAFTITYEDGRLVGRWNPAPDPEMARVVLVALTGDWFLTGFFDEKGTVYDLETEMVFEFAMQEGRAVSFEIRGLGDAVMATGKRRA
jgi:DUF2911 family protein